MSEDSKEDRFREWRSILTLIIFFLANFCVVVPFHIPFYIPKWIILYVRAHVKYLLYRSDTKISDETVSRAVIKFRIPINFTTAPLIAVLFLLVTTAITTEELRRGILGSDNLVPLDIVAFALTIGYISGSIDASGFLRYLNSRLLQAYGRRGHRLFLYLYCFFFIAGAFFGNDPIIQMGMLLLTYMTNVSSNIVHPRAWISMQYAIVNIASTIFVSSGTTNVIIASAFNIGFAQYTANTIVPVLATSFVLFPWLLYFVFANESLIPISIAIHPLSAEERALEPPNPGLDKLSAGIGIILMIVTLVVLIVLSVVTLDNNENIPVFWVTLPAAFIMLVWDIFSSWYWRKEIREIARRNREPAPRLKPEQEAIQTVQGIISPSSDAGGDISNDCQTRISTGLQDTETTGTKLGYRQTCGIHASCSTKDKKSSTLDGEKQHTGERDNIEEAVLSHLGSPSLKISELDHHLTQPEPPKTKGNTESCISTIKRWLPESFLTTMFILARLPYTVVPFAIPMFVLVQALVEKGWVVLLARGWSIWVVKTGTVGAIGGMGFLSVILSNFAGTNIGATVLLCRVLQTWQKMDPSSVSLDQSPDSISDRTWWGAVYALALGVNYGAFSISFGASLAGLSWREDLAKNHLHVRGYEFAKVNLPIIAAAMSVGCAVLVGQVYITR